MKTLEEQIKSLSNIYKKNKDDEFYEYINYILKDEYSNKFNNLRLYNTLTKTKTLYEQFMKENNINISYDNVIFNKGYKESCIETINNERKVLINLKNNTKDLYELVKYTSILYFSLNNDDIVTYIKTMLLEKKLTDFLIKNNYSQIECYKIKMSNLMEIIYISNILGCEIEEIRKYSKSFMVDNSLIEKLKLKIKKCIDCNLEFSKYNLINSKKYIYGIIYSTYLYNSDIDLIEFLNKNMDFLEFKELYIKDDKEKILSCYDKEYRS